MTFDDVQGNSLMLFHISLELFECDRQGVDPTFFSVVFKYASPLTDTPVFSRLICVKNNQPKHIQQIGGNEAHSEPLHSITLCHLTSLKPPSCSSIKQALGALEAAPSRQSRWQVED